MHQVRAISRRFRPLRLVGLVALTLWAMVLAGCEDFRFPRDPNGTLERVLASGRVRVAAVDHPPWVVVGSDVRPRGAEVELVEAFARQLGVAVEWHRMPGFKALEALKHGEFDLAVGGFTQQAVQAHKSAAQTYAYFTEELVIAAEPGRPIPQELDGLEVYVTPDLMASKMVEDRDGIPVSRRSDAVHLIALPHWKVSGSNFVPTGIRLAREKHVMAVPRGENAWLMRLERFLREQAGTVAPQLREHAS